MVKESFVLCSQTHLLISYSLTPMFMAGDLGTSSFHEKKKIAPLDLRVQHPPPSLHPSFGLSQDNDEQLTVRCLRGCLRLRTEKKETNIHAHNKLGYPVHPTFRMRKMHP